MTDSLQSVAQLLAKAAVLRDQGRLELAEGLCRQAAAAAPNAAEPHHGLGLILGRQGRLEDSEAALRRALSLAPGAAATASALGLLLLSQGRHAEGFALYEARHAFPKMAKPSLPHAEWRGENLAGRSIVIWPEQGLGDQIQFARFAPVLQARGAEVTLLCAEPLARLFAGSLDVRVLAAAGAVDFGDPDYWVMTCSLAGRLGVGLDDIPTAPYLRAVSAGPELPPGFKVGLVTAGNPSHPNDAHRSLPAEEAARLAGLDAMVIDLSPAATGARDFADTAALVEQLDLVITVDTATAHLAGAMGKPCWVLVSAIDPDWRWLHERTDSPWYPSVRVYRQPAAGRWAEVVSRVLADVRAMDRDR